MFKLTNYDVVALDFDTTLIQYNLKNLFDLQYKYLTEFLKSKKGYSGLSTEMNEDDIDFIRRGLFLDFKRGNILDLSAEGVILNASHGTKKLVVNQISSIYPDRKWFVTDCFVRNKYKMEFWEGSLANHSHTFVEYYELSANLVFAKLIDLLDDKGIKNYDKVWPDVKDAVNSMYGSNSALTRSFLADISHYVYKTEPRLINFLKKLSERCKLLIITSISLEIVQEMAEFSLGFGWECIFHSVICNVRKLDFFAGATSFLEEYGHEIELKSSNGFFKQGNWHDLYEVIAQELSKPPKCVYFGDSLLDIYSTSVASKPIDTVAVVDETLADGTFPGDHEHADCITSDFWGPYFGENNNSAMADIIIKNSKLCVPSLMYFTENPIDHEYIQFWELSE